MVSTFTFSKLSKKLLHDELAGGLALLVYRGSSALWTEFAHKTSARSHGWASVSAAYVPGIRLSGLFMGQLCLLCWFLKLDSHFTVSSSVPSLPSLMTHPNQNETDSNFLPSLKKK